MIDEKEIRDAQTAVQEAMERDKERAQRERDSVRLKADMMLYWKGKAHAYEEVISMFLSGKEKEAE